MKLEQARVLLTGASGGIGTAMAEALQQRGAQVLGVCRRVRPAAALSASSHALGASGMDWVQADLSGIQGLRTVAHAARQWGAQVVVQAAGLPAFGPLNDSTPEQVAELLQTNLWAPMVLTQALLPHLLTQPAARLVFVGSALGRIGVPGYSIYGASKAGLHGFAEALRRELRGSTVQVQLLAPRTTRTAFNGLAAQRYAAATGSASDTPARVAQELISLIESNAAERFIGWPEKALVRLNGAVGPRLDGGFRRHREMLYPPQLEGTPT
jgi:short-subunit dehydrogenase